MRSQLFCRPEEFEEYGSYRSRLSHVLTHKIQPGNRSSGVIIPKLLLSSSSSYDSETEPRIHYRIGSRLMNRFLVLIAILISVAGVAARAQVTNLKDFKPVTDETLLHPDPADWL